MPSNLLCFDRSLIKLSLTRLWLVNNSTGAVIRYSLFFIKRLFFGELRTPQSPSVLVAQFSYCVATALSFAVSISHIYTHTPPVGLLRTSEQLVSEAATYTTHNKYKRRTFMFSAEFEPVVPAIKRPNTYAFDRTATEIGSLPLTALYDLGF